MQARHLTFRRLLFIAPTVVLILLFAGTPSPLSAEGQAGAGSKLYFTRYATIFFSTDEDLAEFTRNIGSGLSLFTEDRGKDPCLTP